MLHLPCMNHPSSLLFSPGVVGSPPKIVLEVEKAESESLLSECERLRFFKCWMRVDWRPPSFAGFLGVLVCFGAAGATYFMGSDRSRKTSCKRGCHS